MIRPPSWRAILLMLAAVGVAELLGASGFRVAAGLLGVGVCAYELGMLGWLAVCWAQLLLAEQRERRGHPDEERAVTRARWSLAARGDRP